jgi:hypothetical protein
LLLASLEALQPSGFNDGQQKCRRERMES